MKADGLDAGRRDSLAQEGFQEASHSGRVDSAVEFGISANGAWAMVENDRSEGLVRVTEGRVIS